MLAAILKLMDVGGMLVAFLIATFLVFISPWSVSIEHFLTLRLSIPNVCVLIGLLLVWHLGFSVFGLYEPGPPLLGRNRTVAVLGGTAFGAIALLVAAILFKIEFVSMHFVAVFWCLSAAGLIGGRFLLFLVAAQLRDRPNFQRRVLIVGTGSSALQYGQKIERNPENGCSLIGFVDDLSPEVDFSPRIICDLEKLPFFLRDNVVDDIVIALPISVLGARAPGLLVTCKEFGVTVRLLSTVLDDLNTVVIGRNRLESDIVMTIYHGALEGWPQVVKRVLDISFSIVLIALLAPLLLLTTLAVKATSSGPVLFGQQRIGFNRRRFPMLKFRTMYVGSENRLEEIEHLNEATGPVFKMRNDPRITPLGKLLRRWSIDELPQLINVLRGEMSLVGPRPLPLRDVALFEEDRHRRRFSVRPGITGLWQVSDRSSLSFERWMALDMRYIDEWSLLQDLRILAKTLTAVIQGKGAF